MFGGTGTVATVSHKAGRKFIHIDTSKEYCETARKRLEKVKSEMSQKKINQ
ncbi:MAG: site-specific DNA-methyltransferase [Nanoarchaeota archaeon]|nr:site-specific DNA-methyltransferase [Nanoarchaeota archaeon]